MKGAAKNDDTQVEAIEAASQEVRRHFPSTGIARAVAEDVVRAYLERHLAAIRKGEA